MPAARGSGGEVPTQTEVAVPARATRGIDPARPTREPRVQHDPLADLQLRDVGTQLGHFGDHFVAEHGGGGEIPIEGAVAEVLPEIHEDLFGVGAADAGEPRLGHHPPVPGRVGLLALFESHRRLRQPDQQVIPVIWWRPGFRLDAVGESFHRVPPECFEQFNGARFTASAPWLRISTGRR